MSTLNQKFNGTHDAWQASVESCIPILSKHGMSERATKLMLNSLRQFYIDAFYDGYEEGYDSGIKDADL